MHVKIVRHSERYDYKYPYFWLFYPGYYWCDPPLTTNGQSMAVSKAQELHDDAPDVTYDLILTSPYLRTMQTSTEFKSVFKSSEIVIEPLLAEYQPWFKHTIQLYPDGLPCNYDGNETDFTYPETLDQFKLRVEFIIDKLINKYNGSNIIIVTHGEVLKSFIGKLNALCPELELDEVNVPYLTTLSFDFVNEEIVRESIKITL